MAFMQWSDALSVGIKEIDNQHAQLVALINKLHEAMRSGKTKEALSEILKELISYTGNHFATEEKYFDQFKYEATATHKIEHKKLVQQVLDFQKQFESGKISLSIDIMNFLGDWLKNHIQGTDKKYIACFQKNGVK
ncbi:MAG: hemerythrin family protein [Deltaproteobacteria bacterium]|nr:hemerythrin family protein [Deltaproteobacteria bacterium]